MGASLVPSYIFMAYWMDLYIWAEHPYSHHLVYYGKYNDNVIDIWQDDTNRIKDFLQYCNNSFGIHFKSVANPNDLLFLDLELFHDQDSTICSQTHFKPTAGNSYLHRKSCHHKKW